MPTLAGPTIGLLAPWLARPDDDGAVSPALMATNGNGAADAGSALAAAPADLSAMAGVQGASSPSPQGMLGSALAQGGIDLSGAAGLLGGASLPASPPGSPTLSLPPGTAMPPATAGPSMLPPGMAGPPPAMPTGGPTSMPTAAPAPSADAVPPTSLLGRVQNWLGDHRATLMALGAGMAGAQSLGQGLNRGGMLAGPAMQVDLRQAQQNATIKALMQRGLPQDVATAAATNPAVMAQLLPQVFGAKQLQPAVVGTDVLGHPIHGTFNPATGKYYDIAGREIGAGGATGPGQIGGAGGIGSPGMTPERWAQMSSEDRLKTFDPQIAGELKAIHEGRQPGTGRNVQQLFPLVNQVYPDFDATQYPVRLKLRQSYAGGGADFKEVQALNTVSGHMHDLMQSAQGLNNSDWTSVNKFRDWRSDHISDNPALVKFRNDLVTTQNELAKAYHGGHVTDAAFSAFNKAINEDMSPTALKAAIGELSHLLSSKIEAKEEGYRAGMAQIPLPSDYRAISDKARKSFGDINDWASGVPQQTNGAAAPAGAHAASAPMSAQDQQALAWANSNPTDPRAAQIKQRLGAH